MSDEERALTTRISEETFRRLKIESVLSGEPVRDLVEQALRALLDGREDDRRRVVRDA